ncbi:hypothetical protein CAPTEDRAFT_92469 [Capitella teleta]|uniref:acireductone dioxygenase (Fe(2+)-requiring) n=1 Tax=Capitella teleta TaxID=283909 RepID=R7U6L2_CAPTE|nr:hypothetical protein CAPTEDRAFT_92469 [Capitella teleta]|eukprot:ELU01980.1 hypothetical protein CAPTEDRAFT_92469 [Capitella teleta]
MTLLTQLDACDWRKEGKLVEIMANRGYSAQDCIELSKDKTESFEEKMTVLFTEHLHIDEELRFVIDGTGYFDVRDRDERWIRIETTKGDLIVIPAGIYHRFALDKNDYIKVIRCFSEEPLWKAYNRSDPATEKMDARQKYIASTN